MRTACPALAIAALFAFIHPVTAFSQTTDRQAYILRYKDMAVSLMQEYGVPASIILAQAVLESDSGRSTLARKANNHFCIKCHNWSGKSFFWDDDEKGECFRKYPSAEASFRDHSVFLSSRPRYASLFACGRDYRKWAQGLGKSGYATNPEYGALLLGIIESEQLYRYDCSPEALPASAAASETESAFFLNRPVYTCNGRRYVRAFAGDTYASLSKEFRLFTGELRAFNDLSGPAEPVPGERIYIERKRKYVRRGSGTYTVSDADLYPVRSDWRLLSQSLGIRLESLLALNKLQGGTPVYEGQVLKLRK